MNTGEKSLLAFSRENWKVAILKNPQSLLPARKTILLRLNQLEGRELPNSRLPVSPKACEGRSGTAEKQS